MSDRDDSDAPEPEPGGPVEAVDPFASLGLGGLGGEDGLPDLGGLMDGLAKVQAIQAGTYVGQAGGGVIRITANGRMEVESVVISAEVIDPDDAELLGDLVVAAFHDLTAQIAAAQKDAMGPLGDLLG